MSAYDNDPRVQRYGRFVYAVDVDGARFNVDIDDDAKDRWWISEGVWRHPSSGGCKGPHHSADEAIRSLIGDPR